MNLFNGNADNSVKVLMADAGISGLLYALPESGDQLALFMIDIQSGQAAKPMKKGGARGTKSAQAKYGFASGSDCQLLGILKLSDLNNEIGTTDRIEQLLSVRGQLVLLSQQGRVFTMEALTVEQMLVQPMFDEVKINLRSFVDKRPLESTELSQRDLPILQIKKSQAEQNNEKGSQNLVLLPINHRGMDNRSTVSLVSLDYSPMPSKSKLFQSDYKNERDSYTMESLRNLASYFQQLGQIGLMDDSGTSSIGYKSSSTAAADAVFSNLMNASSEETARGSWTMVNYLLGIIAFIMFAYLIKTMQKKGGSSARGGGGGPKFGGRGGRASGPFGGARGRGGGRLGGGSGRRK